MNFRESHWNWKLKDESRLDFDRDLPLCRNRRSFVARFAGGQPIAMATILQIAVSSNVRSAGACIFLPFARRLGSISVGGNPRDA